MTNVVMLNLSYDVCVKLGSLHILFLALVLLAPDLTRLHDFFVLNRATVPADLGPHLARTGLQRFSVALKTLVICSLVAYLTWDTCRTYSQHQAAFLDKPTPPEGWYRVVSLKKDGQTLPPLTVDDFRWQTLWLRGGDLSVQSMDESRQRFKLEGDPLEGTAVLYPVDAKNQRTGGFAAAGFLNLSVKEGTHATMQGVLNGHDFEAVLDRENPADFPLMSRGFRWITESPYFR
jgi:hypothetical protein